MKTFLSTILLLIIVSCNTPRKEDKPKQEIPKALDGKNSSLEIITKRGAYDLVENLYNELAAKDSSLKKLEDQMDELNKNKQNSMQPFDEFNEKNQSYFNSANGHMESIKDSLLKNKMRSMLANQLIKYNSSIAQHKELLKKIDTNKLTISDLHTVVKLVSTLPLIDKYQKEYLPETKSLKDYIKKQDEAIKYINTLIIK